jgi:DNA-binding XRE family transcriptional regulator
MKTNNDIITFEEHLNKRYGEKGTSKRNDFEEGFENFRIGVLIYEARKKKNLTQQQLAERTGTTKNYISRIENDASDIRLSTLMRIVHKGLEGNIKLSLTA